MAKVKNNSQSQNLHGYALILKGTLHKSMHVNVSVIHIIIIMYVAT